MRPARTGRHDGLAYALWLPEAGPAAPEAGPAAPDAGAETAPEAGAETLATAGVVTLHGAGSCKENHYDFARAVIATGLAAMTFDQRGHGESEGPLDARAIDDVVAMADLLRAELGDRNAPVVLRGSSMGGYLALAGAAPARAAAVVAICPASADGLRRGLRDGSFDFAADVEQLEPLLDTGDLRALVPRLTMPILLLHARGDERVPVALSRELAADLQAPDSRLIEVPGGHHQSIQHDEELQAVSLRFIDRALGRPLRSHA